MSYIKFFRLSGLIAMLSFAVTLLFNIGLFANFIPRSWEYWGYLVMTVLFTLALIGVYVRQVDKAGYLGLVGFFLAEIGMFLSIIWFGYASLVFPVLRTQFPEAIQSILGGPLGIAIMVNMYLGFLGNLIFYMATIRAKVLPAWGAWMVIAGLVIGFFPVPLNLGTIISAAGLAWLGYAMWSAQTKYAPSVQPQLAT
ncbi:MAG TPA: hypothetical protein VFZ76_08845 [Anaerolineales bacterium]